jgi:Spy/CpxP family protein refolding chaperone
MKRLITFLGIALLFGAVSGSVAAQERGMGFYPRMGYGPGMGGFPLGPGYSPLTEEQRTQLDELNKKFQDETAELREALSGKSQDLYTLLNTEEPDAKKAKALLNEISEMRAKLALKALDHQLEVRKILPKGYAKGWGRGYGPPMGYDPLMGRGPGMHWGPRHW